MDWHTCYPHYFALQETGDNSVVSNDKKVEFLDIGCGYGGLLGKYESFQYFVYQILVKVLFYFIVELSPLFPEILILGLEIRVKVSDYTKDRITGLRQAHPGQYQNVACLRSNAMKYLPNFFHKGQVRVTGSVVALQLEGESILSCNVKFFF